MTILRNHMTDALLAAIAALALAVTLSVEQASAMDVPPPVGHVQVLAP